MERDHDPGGPPKGFIGTENSSVNSVFSNLTETNKTGSNKEVHKTSEQAPFGEMDAPDASVVLYRLPGGFHMTSNLVDHSAGPSDTSNISTECSHFDEFAGDYKAFE